MSSPLRDVVVVGAGPAGSAAAAFLRIRGHDVLVLDEARFPRDKICGESVSPEAWFLLDALGATRLVEALSPRTLRGMRLVSPDGTSFEGLYRGRERPGFALRRTELDQALLDNARRAGAEVREGARVRGLLRRETRVEGVLVEDAGSIREVRARLVIGADGRRSVVARALGALREHPRLRRFAVRGHWADMEGLGETGEMHVGGGGYCGVAPLAAGAANVTFVLDRDAMRPAGGDLEGFYRRTILSLWPRLAERLERARLLAPPRAIGPLALQSLALTFPGALLVGDAAGFYDPFTGEGVTLALRGAEIASRAVDAALRSSGERVLPRLLAYERERRDATRAKFRFNRLLQRIVAWPWAADAVARRLARRPDLADLLVGVAGDFVPARSALGVRFLGELLRA